jgi:hypothetical protein
MKVRRIVPVLLTSSLLIYPFAVDPYWYVIDKSLITGNGATYLGRPWRNYARVVFQQSYLGASVNHTGWSEWTPTDQRTNHTVRRLLYRFHAYV